MKIEATKQSICIERMDRGHEVIFYIVHPDLELEFDESGEYAHYQSKEWDNRIEDRDRVAAEFTISRQYPCS